MHTPKKRQQYNSNFHIQMYKRIGKYVKDTASVRHLKTSSTDGIHQRAICLALNLLDLEKKSFSNKYIVTTNNPATNTEFPN